ncbi:MAG: S1 RNA-binding domain-containing protein [Otoolea sp.]|nr:S1 RNA-binding domain-containing protein [Clostridiaceae bacterium]MDD6075051.1 S1 RNA-binding domain-containing protein [Clostridium sp.]
MSEERMPEEMETAAGTAQEKVPEEKVESMDDYAAELEASFKRLNVGDIVTGTVIGVTDTQVLLDLKYYAEGVIDKENLSNDPDFNMKEEIHPGEEITATVIRTDDGEGNLVLSRKEANDRLAWEKLRTMMEERTVVPVTITEIVKGGAVAKLEGMRGFIPASRLDAAYVENLEEWLGRRIDVTVITADEENHKLVLSGREAAREKQQEEKNRRIARCEVGAIMEGTVETIKPYGAFVTLENGLTGLVHISQISKNRIKHPAAVLKEGQKVTVKIISTADHKISLSMKEVVPDEAPEEEVFNYKESGEATTGFAELLKGLKF